MAAEFGIGKTVVYDADQFLLENLAGLPYLLVGHIINALETAFVVVVSLEFRTEDLGMHGLPFLGSPRRIMHTVGHIADVEFFRKIALVHAGENFLADFPVEH